MRWPQIALGAITLVLAAACDRAAADTTLRYAVPDNPKQTFTIEAASEGRLRVEDEFGQVMLTRDGVTYLIFSPPSGGRAVTRLDDYLAVGAELRARMLEDGFLSRDDPTRYAPRQTGTSTRTVGSWQGHVYEIGPVEDSGLDREIVISTDPALAEVRPLAVAAFEALERRKRAIMIYPEPVVRWTSETLSRGMPISYDGLDLQSIGREPIPPDRFEVPQPLLSRDQLRALLNR